MEYMTLSNGVKLSIGLLLSLSVVGCSAAGQTETNPPQSEKKAQTEAAVTDIALSGKVGVFDIDHDRVRLNSGYDMPLVGVGTWAISDKEAEESTYQALSTGMRLIDTAVVYGNEAGVGRGIKRSGVPREEIFVTTKLWTPDYAHAEESIDQCLKRLDIDYIDLLLLHYPGPNDEKAYKDMEKALKSGKVRSIGLSNFYEDDFDRIMKIAEIMPAVNQLETHLHHQNEAMKEHMNPYGTVLESWFPFGGRDKKKEMFAEPLVQKMAAEHRKSPAQIILRWHLQAGHVVMPGSTNPAHIQENYDIFNFSLSNEEMQELGRLERNALYGGY